jgi:predicted HD superfamily hydrolase involved in NAD metabolism
MPVTAEDRIFAKQMEVPARLREHMRAVAEMAAGYAAEVGYDPDVAYVAGMAHDIMRVAPESEILSMVAKANFDLTPAMRARPMLAHGPAAAVWLMEHAPDVGDEVIEAVKDHTFPASDAPILTQILAVADTLEPSRNLPERDRIREAKMSFEERFKLVFELKQSYRTGIRI